MQVELTTLNQEMSLEEGTVTNFIVLRFPSGELVRALIADEAVNVVIKARIGTEESSSLYTEIPIENLRILPDQLAMAVANTEGITKADIHSAPLEDYIVDPRAPDYPGGLPKPPPGVKSKITRVEKDDWGYPVLQGGARQNPDDVIGKQEPDEDGVGQF